MSAELEQERARTHPGRRASLARSCGLLLFLALILAACGSSGSEAASDTSGDDSAEETETESSSDSETAEETPEAPGGVEQVQFEIPVVDADTQAQAAELLSDPVIAAAVEGAAEFDPTATDALNSCIAEQSIVQNVNLSGIEDLVTADPAAAEALGLEVAFLAFQCSPGALVDLIETDIGQLEDISEEQLTCTISVFTEMVVGLSVSDGTEFMFSGEATPPEWIDSAASRCDVSADDAIFILG